MKGKEIEDGFWVFVSHSTKDFEKVRLVRNALEESGFRPILFYLKCMEDEDEINELLKREIDSRRRFILCDSPNAQASKYVRSEVDYIRSKKRMYEIVDLSSINLDSENYQQDVLQLIKPFRKRTSVSILYQDSNKSIVRYVIKSLSSQGFNGFDCSFFDTQRFYGDMGSLEKWIQFIRQYVKSTLQDGYLLYFIGGDRGDYFDVEVLNSAIEFAPNMIFPVRVKECHIPDILYGRAVLDVSKMTSDEEKAEAIVNALIDFDLKNNK